MRLKAKVKATGEVVNVYIADFFIKEFQTVNEKGIFKTYEGDEIELSVDGNTSDGSHTFDELYYHRMILFASICQMRKERAWKSYLHDDGTMFPDYFIVGITTSVGQFTYHYHKRYWNMFDVKELDRAPAYDGHTANDVTRLLILPSETNA